jgi:hypothetical protein
MPNLTNVPALDLAIGLAFIYLLLSLFCSTVRPRSKGHLRDSGWASTGQGPGLADAQRHRPHRLIDTDAVPP